MWSDVTLLEIRKQKMVNIYLVKQSSTYVLLSSIGDRMTSLELF